MISPPERHQQIAGTHAALIHHVVAACREPQAITRLEAILRSSEANGWTDLVAAIRKILGGRRDEALLKGLDEEDGIIVSRILMGLRDPATLPGLDQAADAASAAPGLAAMIDSAASGDTRALQIISEMATQMSRAGGDMARLAAVIRPMINGERDPQRLCTGMGAQGESLVLSILSELGALQQH